MGKRLALREALRDGHRVRETEQGVILSTTNPADRPKNERPGFNLNLARRTSIEKLIADRHGKACTSREYAFGYATIVVSALVMARVLRGWKPDTRPALAWIETWCPCVTEAEARRIAGYASHRPRGLTARRAGMLAQVTKEEIDRLNLRTLWPIDQSPEKTLSEVRLRKNKADRERLSSIRREEGVRPIQEITAGSVADFCRRHGINRSSYRQAAQRGAEALRAFLTKKGAAEENWPDLSVCKRTPTEYNSATPLASFVERPAAKFRIVSSTIPADMDREARFERLLQSITNASAKLAGHSTFVRARAEQTLHQLKDAQSGRRR